MGKRGRVARREFFAQVGAGFVLGGLPAASAAADVSPEPVADLDELESTIQSVIASKRIGRPVFVRLTWYGDSGKREVLPRLGRLGRVAARWLDQQLDRAYGAGSIDSGQVSL